MSTRISACTVRLALALLVASAALPSSVAAANWQVTTVNGAAYTGRSSAITVGFDGVAHIGYWDVLAGPREWSPSLTLLTPGLYLVRATGRAGVIGSVRVFVTR